MFKKYMFWWTDPIGNRLQQMENFSFFSWAKIVNGIGTLDIGFPLAKYPWLSKFEGDRWSWKDYRVEMWRSPKAGVKHRLEDIYWMHTPIVRTRESDGVDVFEMVGKNGIGQLQRRIVKYKSGSAQASKTDYIDDMMKEIVDEQMGSTAYTDDNDRGLAYNKGYFRIQPDASQGSSQTKSFAYGNMLDVLKELSKLSKQNTPYIIFDVVPITTQIFEFQTFKNYRGSDRRMGIGQGHFLFSKERGNLGKSRFVIEGAEEQNVMYAGGQGEGDVRDVQEAESVNNSKQTIWSRREGFKDARRESTSAGVLAEAQQELEDKLPKPKFIADFLDIDGSRYGIDWDWGDLVTAQYAGQTFDCEIKIVYGSMDENGNESIEGRNEFGGFDQ